MTSLEDNLNASETLLENQCNETDNSGEQVSNMPTASTLSCETDTSYSKVVSKRRWFILSSYCLLSLSACSSWLCFPAVSNIIRPYYDIQLIHVNMLSIIFGIAIILVSLPFALLIERFGLSVGLKFAVTLNTIGATIRYWGFERTYGYWLLLFGNMFTAFSVAGFLFLPGKIASVWFPLNEIATATAICIAFDAVGTGIGFIHATSMIENSDEVIIIEENIRRFLFSQLIIAILVFVFIFVFTKKAPLHNFDNLQSQHLQLNSCVAGKNDIHSESLCSYEKKSSMDVDKRGSLDNNSHSSDSLHYWSLHVALFKLLRNQDFQLIILIQGITAAIEGIYEMLLNEMLIERFPGYEKVIGIVGFISIILGFVTNILVGIIIDRTGACKLASFLVFLISTICCVIWTIFMECFLHIFALAIIFCLLMSVCTSYYTIAFTHSTQIAATSSPTAIGVLLVLTSQIYDTVVSIVITEILDNFGALGVNLFAVFLSTIAVIATLFIKGKM